MSNDTSKTVQNVKNSLKFKAQEREGVLSIKVGVRKFAVPISARMLSNGEFLFLSFPASSELYLVKGKELEPMAKDDDATEAFVALNPGRRTRRRRNSDVRLPDELEVALRSLPSGYKLGYGVDGTPKLVRTRNRSKKG